MLKKNTGLKQRLWIACLFALACSGCSTFGVDPEKNPFGDRRVTSASPNQMIYKSFEGFTLEQLLHLLDPNTAGGFQTTATIKKFSQLTTTQQEIHLRKAFREANTSYDLAHRSQVQDRMIAASNQRCNLYFTYLKRLSTYSNGIFGILTTALGGAGAIVQDQDAARLLSGLSGIASGTRAELNQAIFESVATSVIVPGIKIQRKTLLLEIQAKRTKTLAEYTVEGAVADAIEYHGACSMDTGIQFAQKSIQSFEDLGIDRFTAAQEKLGVARSLSAAFTGDSLAAVVSAERSLADLNTLLMNSQASVDALDSGDATHAAFIGRFNQLKTDVGGALATRAVTLDDELKSAMLNFASTTGTERSAAQTLLQAQKIKVDNFKKELDAKGLSVVSELESISQ